MFDLFRSRQKAVRYILGAMLMLVALSMVITLIPGYGSSTGNSNTDNSTLATIGGEKVTAQQVQQILQQWVRSGRIPPDMMEVYAPQFVEQMILEKASVYEFQRMGLSVSDEEVLTGLQSQFPQYFQNGQLTSKDQFEAAVAQQGMTLQDVIDAMRYQLLLRKVQNTLLTTAVVSPKEVEEELVRKNEKAKIAYIAFPPAKFREGINPTTEELRAYFEAHRAQYTIPEKRSFQALVVDQAKVESALTVSDAQLRAAYSANMDNFRMPERVHVRHILIKTVDKSDAEKKQLLAKAQDILKQLKSGADFAALAKKDSDDPGSGEKGGDLGWVVRGQMVPEFEKAVFSLPPKQLSDIVTTEYGYHIIEVLEKEPAHVKSFDEVKASLADELKKQGVNDKIQSIADQVHAALEKSPGSAADIAKQFGVDLVTVSKESAGEAIPSLGVSPEIDGALNTMNKNDVSQPIMLPANRLVIVVLTDKAPARPADFADVESKVREQVVSDKAQTVAADRAKEAAVKLKAGANMEALAKSMKLEVTQSSEFGRSDSVEGLGPASYVDDAFNKPVGTVVGPLAIQGRDVIYRVVDKKGASPAQLSADRGAVLDQLKHKKALAENELFMDSILVRLKAEGKVKIYPDAIKRMSASLRS